VASEGEPEPEVTGREPTERAPIPEAPGASPSGPPGADRNSLPEPADGHAHGAASATGLRLAKLTFGAVGVVYGDIGTSPLYAVRECFDAHHGVPANEANVLGIISLIFWALLVIIVTKYLIFVMRADNEGEGGILSLMTLLIPKTPEGRTRATGVLILLGLFGAALLYGDAIITPAISVLSAVEGLAVANEVLTPLAVPLSVTILVMLFVAQKYGAGRLGIVFGLVTTAWFVAIAVMAWPAIAARPGILWALSPHYAVMFFVHNGFRGFTLLGSIVLCVTGGEALYADMGHFGRRAIRVAWFVLVYPALLLNYFGQGALLLAHPELSSNPFYALVPEPYLYPMIVLATGAAVVASQALISGAYSIARQATQLGYFPRITVIHTSRAERGQIYVPEVNEAMMVGCLVLVVAFGSSSALAAAYGAAATGTMAITTVLFYAAMRTRIGEARARQLLMLFAVFDIGFLGANALKITHGGWVPLVVAVVVFSAMTTWHRGRDILRGIVTERGRPIGEFMQELAEKPPLRVPGTAVFMSSTPNIIPPVLLHHLRHNKVLHERIVLLNVRTENVPEVPSERRVKIEGMACGFTRVSARYGFMQSPVIPDIARAATEAGCPIPLDDTTFYLGRETLLPTGTAKLMRWRKRLFVFLSRNARHPTAYFQIPTDRVVEMGMQIEL
jgi:KUP system potassium uptake protein